MLKVVSLYMGALPIFVAFSRTAHLYLYWNTWFFTIFTFILLGSAMILPLGIGFDRNGHGFQGIFSHPQTFGTISSLMTIWFIGIYFLGYRKDLWILTAGISSFFLLFLSQARTGLVAFLGGLLISGLIGIARNNFEWLRTRQLRIFAFSIFLFFISLVLFPNKILGVLIGFIQKRIGDYQSNISLADTFQESRGSLLERSLENFYDYPIWGIGLGVPSEYTTLDYSKIETFMGIPISASVEKGFLPSAILEEMGLYGAFFTILLLCSITFTLSKKGYFLLLWLFLGSILINSGEAVLFSISGIGLFIWLIMGYTYFSARGGQNH